MVNLMEKLKGVTPGGVDIREINIQRDLLLTSLFSRFNVLGKNAFAGVMTKEIEQAASGKLFKGDLRKGEELLKTIQTETEIVEVSGKPGTAGYKVLKADTTYANILKTKYLARIAQAAKNPTLVLGALMATVGIGTSAILASVGTKGMGLWASGEAFDQLTWNMDNALEAGEIDLYEQNKEIYDDLKLTMSAPSSWIPIKGMKPAIEAKIKANDLKQEFLERQKITIAKEKELKDLQTTRRLEEEKQMALEKQQIEGGIFTPETLEAGLKGDITDVERQKGGDLEMIADPITGRMMTRIDVQNLQTKREEQRNQEAQRASELGKPRTSGGSNVIRTSNVPIPQDKKKKIKGLL